MFNILKELLLHGGFKVTVNEQDFAEWVSCGGVGELYVEWAEGERWFSPDYAQQVFEAVGIVLPTARGILRGFLGVD